MFSIQQVQKLNACLRGIKGSVPPPMSQQFLEAGIKIKEEVEDYPEQKIKEEEQMERYPCPSKTSYSTSNPNPYHGRIKEEVEDDCGEEKNTTTTSTTKEVQVEQESPSTSKSINNNSSVGGELELECKEKMSQEEDDDRASMSMSLVDCSDHEGEEEERNSPSPPALGIGGKDDELSERRLDISVSIPALSPQGSSNLKDVESNPPVLTRCGSAPQYCIWCSTSFRVNNDYASHIMECYPLVKHLIDFPKKKCLVCNMAIRGFNVTGLLRHAFGCIIVDRKERIQKELERKEKGGGETKDEGNSHRQMKKEREATVPSTGTQTQRPTRAVVVNKMKQETQEKNGPDAEQTGSYTLRTRQSLVREVNGDVESKLSQNPPSKVEILNKFFAKNNHPRSNEVKKLAGQTGMRYAEVRRWFETRLNGGQTKVSSKRQYLRTPEYSEKVLKAFFKQKLYPSPEEKQELVEKTQLSMKQVNIWFVNARKKGKENERSQPSESCSRTSLRSEDASFGSRMPLLKSEPTKPKPRPLSKQGKRTTEEEYSSFEDLPKNSKDILMEAFQRNSTPSVVEVIHLSQQTGLVAAYIQKWYDENRRSGGHDEKADYEDEDIPNVSFSTMTIRQKLVALKRLSVGDIAEILTSRKEVISRVLYLYASADSGARKSFHNDCSKIRAAMEELKPFTKQQMEYFQNWKEDFVMQWFPEKDERAWRENVYNFGNEILIVCSRLIVFGHFIDMGMQAAADVIFQISDKGDSKDQQNCLPVLELFEQLQTPNSEDIDMDEV